MTAGQIALPSYLEGNDKYEELKRASNAQADTIKQLVEVLMSHKAAIEELQEDFKVHGQRIKNVEVKQGKKQYGPTNEAQNLPKTPKEKVKESTKAKNRNQKVGGNALSEEKVNGGKEG